MTPSLSVVLCTCDGASFLEAQLASIAAQTRLPDELVVGDDCSTDQTLDMLQTYAAHALFPVRICRNPRRLGSTKNFDATIQRCQGEVIALADQDDVWQQNKLEELLSALKQNPDATYAFSDGEIVDANGILTGDRLWQMDSCRKVLPANFGVQQFAVLLHYPIVTGATMMFRQDLKPAITPIPESWVHDYWISLIGSFIGCGVPVNECLLQYRRHQKQQIGANPRTLSTMIRRSACATELLYRNDLGRFRQLRDRLVSLESRHTEQLALLDQKIEHLEQRLASQSARGIARTFTVLREALTGRYQRFSGSWRSILRDLCPEFALARLQSHVQ